VIFALILLMNSQNEPPDKDKLKQKNAVAVAPKKKPPKKPKPRQIQRRKLKAQKTPRAPLPNLAASISGISFGLPHLSGISLDEAGNELLGDRQAMKNMVMTEDSVDVAPRPLVRSAPKYPSRARAKGISGTVSLSLLIDASGNVQRIKVLDANPAGVFEESAVEAVRNWRFEPAMYNGEKVRVWARQVLRFDLS